MNTKHKKVSLFLVSLAFLALLFVEGCKQNLKELGSIVAIQFASKVNLYQPQAIYLL